MAWYTEESEHDMRRKAADEAARLARAASHCATPSSNTRSTDDREHLMSNDLARMTSPEAREAMARSRPSVLPIGSIEQHGPHLPNGTDTMAAELVAQEVAVRLDAVYAPFCPYGVTPIHAGHPGSVTLRRSTFEAVLEDVCTELIAAGAETVILVNWHEGNIASMNAVPPTCRTATASLSSRRRPATPRSGSTATTAASSPTAAASRPSRCSPTTRAW